jgi:hypothetical protein
MVYEEEGIPMIKKIYSPSLEQLDRRELLAVTGIEFLNMDPPKLGIMAAVSLQGTSDRGLIADETIWTYQVCYNGDESAVINVDSQNVWNAQIPAEIPGQLIVTATTYYTSTLLPISPPQPTTVSTSVFIPVPDLVTKGPQVGQPAALGTGIKLLNPITAGGQKIGMLAMGSVQEKIDPFKLADGTELDGTDGEWAPVDPGGSFGLSTATSTIKDVQYLDAPAATWATIAAGGKVTPDGWIQQLQYSWTMAGPGGNFEYSEPLNSLTWTWTKVDDSHWTTN